MPSLRLRIDAPYDGESLSSFVERAAQAYGTPIPVLLRQLTKGCPFSSRRIDLDRFPSDELLEGLDRSVFGWSSPLENMKGFRQWVLAPRQRTAFCPLCFEDDLASGRVPYYRNDWMAVCATSCWQHGTPLSNWPTPSRLRPKQWLNPGPNLPRPDWYQRALDGLDTLRHANEPIANTNWTAAQAIEAIRLLQHQAEKQCDKPFLPQSDSLARAWDSIIYVLSAFAIDRPAVLGHAIEPIAELLRPLGASWFGARPKTLRPREPDLRRYAFRLCGDVQWRRTFLWFVVRTLAGHDSFASEFRRALPNAEPWSQWWNTEVRHACLRTGRTCEFTSMWRHLDDANLEI